MSTDHRDAGGVSAGVDSVAVVEGATVRYRTVVALDRVSLGFPAGVTALLGPNGAGKSTLLSLLSTARTPDEGSVTLLGEQGRGRARVRRLRERIGVLPQAFGYHPRFTVEEFVTYAAWLRNVPAGDRAGRVADALALVDMTAYRDRRMRELSGGMLRRVGIAQAVVNQPELVLLDEPTVGLDPAQRVGFRELIERLGERSAVVLSTHLAEDVAHVCDRVSVLLAGRVRFTGTVGELCALAGDGKVDGTGVEAGYLHLAGGAGDPEPGEVGR
ncbi:ATP-binding cassette domain-containing protein [Streptomyces alkaliterrae]|uniref:ATP-binding cassette domain-containing protein n=1 Tax=Streptomyces alkaliterrae TaxID=2213162 RepID=UPI002B204E9D|nr:ATP-binding cassette domain-containing protein [Streptomyces alkaliterrae]